MSPDPTDAEAVNILNPGEVVYDDVQVYGVVNMAVILECGTTLPDIYIWGFTKQGTDKIKAVVYNFGHGPRVQALAATLGSVAVISHSASLSIDQLPRASEGLYTCQAFYERPEGPEFRYYYVRLTVRVPVSKPYVLLSDASPVEGSVVVLRCGLGNGTSPILYEWEHERPGTLSTTIARANSSMLIMSNVNRNNTGWYRCVVSNAVNLERSDRALMDVVYGPDIPQIDVTPYSLTEKGYSALERERVLLMCQAQSNPPSVYTWYYNNSQVNGGPSFIINKILRSHTGKYACRAQNTQLDTSSIKSINLTVFYPPDGSPSCSVEPVLNHSSLSLQCSWPGGLPAPTLHWTRGLLGLGQEVAVPGQEIDKLSNNVTLPRRWPGRQTTPCSPAWARMRHPTTEPTAACAPVSVTQHTDQSHRTPGTSPFTMSCFFSDSQDSPPAEPVCFAIATRNNTYLMLSCSWNGGVPRALLWWDGPEGSDGGGQPGEGNANILVLRHGSARSGQAYTCRAQHPLVATPKSCRVTLEAPVLVTQRSLVSVYEGGDVQLTCILGANYPPANQITWFNNHRKAVLDVPRKYQLQRAAAWANLTVREADGAQDSGQYWCSTANAVGGAEIAVTLLVLRYPMPPNVTLHRAIYSSRQRGEVELGWRMETDGGGAGGGGGGEEEGGGPTPLFTGFLLEIRWLTERAKRKGGKKDEGSFSEWRASVVTEAGARRHTQGSLAPTNTYQFRVTALNHRTAGHPSAERTPADPPFGAYPAVIGAAIGGMIVAAILTLLILLFLLRNRNSRLRDMLFGMQHGQSRENINFPDDELADGDDLGSSPVPAISLPRAASPIPTSPPTRTGLANQQPSPAHWRRRARQRHHHCEGHGFLACIGAVALEKHFVLFWLLVSDTSL
ncbi:LOW QUALITY PROTEIN: V-set and immunoglobulin domain-containing protein 10-like 2 [Gadus morhua]|uniref:LOW QUALITY PROTEIN: V-set and immunoglobulin domain-containing protein 10-like 2 n=1 Tax=Gadus morhua TaxID=8049 RepID=UPI0011B5C135|nr:LOW QUALITY PROTEIN: V-set and immunoglobulin domain-containing protein 10-like 2 [Gadus morhua]